VGYFQLSTGTTFFKLERAVKSLITKYVALASLFRDLPPLIFRAILVHGFYAPAMNKLNNFSSVVSWFRDDLHIPYPLINAYMSVTTEVSGIILLTLGLATRFISIPMMGVMLVAIATVHWENGFDCGDNGFEVPLYFFFMLFSLVVTGSGRISLDAIIAKKFKENKYA